MVEVTQVSKDGLRRRVFEFNPKKRGNVFELDLLAYIVYSRESKKHPWTKEGFWDEVHAMTSTIDPKTINIPKSIQDEAVSLLLDQIAFCIGVREEKYIRK